MKLDFTYEGTTRTLDLARITMRESADMKSKLGMSPAQWNAAMDAGDGEAAGYGACVRAGDDVDWVDMIDTLNLMALNMDIVMDPPPLKEQADPTQPPEADPTTTPTMPSSGGPSSPDTSDSPDSSDSNESTT